MRKNIISTRNFKASKALAVLAIFALVALLLMIEKVSEVVVQAGNAAGINMPPAPMISVVASNLFLVATGILLVILGGLVLVPIVKFAVIGAGLAMAGWGIYQVYKWIKGEPINDNLGRGK